MKDAQLNYQKKKKTFSQTEKKLLKEQSESTKKINLLDLGNSGNAVE